MGAGRKTQTFYPDDNIQWPRLTTNSSGTARNLRKTDLGGVIFGCKYGTMAECLSKQLFGLPHSHFSYVQNIEEGLPLFLFNYSDRKLHGIFEAASKGHMSYDAYAWTDGGAERTPFPAQVYIRRRTQCPPVPESQFSEVIRDNYYTSQHFWFELDHAQTRGLLSLFNHSSANITWSAASQCIKEPSSPVPATKWKKIGTNSNLNTESSKAIANVSNKDKSGSYHWNDGDIGHSGPQKTSSLVFEDVESKSTVSDWEDLVEDSAQNTGSHSTQFDEVVQTSLQQQSGTVEVEKEEKRVVGLLEKLLLERTCPRSLPKDCTEDRASVCHLVDAHKTTEAIVEHPSDSNQRSNSNDSNHILENAKDMRVSTLSDDANGEHVDNTGIYNLDHKLVTAQLLQVIDELKARTSKLEQQNVESQKEKEKEMEHLRSAVRDAEREIRLLKHRVEELESKNDTPNAPFKPSSDKYIEQCFAVGELETKIDDFNVPVEPSFKKTIEQCFGSDDVIYLIGGFNGNSWLPSLDSFSPLLDVITPLKSMSCARSYAPTVALDGVIYVLGGGDDTLWHDSVECYNRMRDEWTSGPSMLRAKGSLAGAKLNGKIFAIGGGDGVECFSDVDMLDPALGKWLENRPMLHPRFAPSAAALEGVIYAVGGYDGIEYLRSVERFDPREGLWAQLPSMNVRRGCHSLAVLNEKLYCMGGYNGEYFVPSMEIFDPRLNYWVMGEPMKHYRGYAASAVLGNSLFAIGGVKDEKLILDTVECYREGTGWTVSSWKAIGDRCFCSAITL